MAAAGGDGMEMGLLHDQQPNPHSEEAETVSRISSWTSDREEVTGEVQERLPGESHERPDAPPPVANEANSRPFSSAKQTRSLLRHLVWRWLGTVVLLILILATFEIYESKGNFPSGQKITYNVVITGLSLILGLNFFVSPDAFLSRRVVIIDSMRW